MLEALPPLGLRRIAPPDGAFYIYADIGHLTDDSLAFCTRLLRGHRRRHRARHRLRSRRRPPLHPLSFAVSTPEIEEAIRRLAPWFEQAGAAAI